MKSIAKIAIGASLAAVMTVAVAAPAQADPWDGNSVEFGLGDFEYANNDVSMYDASLLLSPGVTEYTDIWDGTGFTEIDSTDAGLNFESVYCSFENEVDVSVDPATGDLVYACIASSPNFTTGGLEVASEVRVYAASDLVRVATTITNLTDADIEIDAVELYTDFGSSGEIWGYQGQDDAILPVPASEDMTSTIALYEAGAQWAIHYNDDDAPGGVAWGNAAATAPADVSEISGDYYEALVSAFTIPAGESRAVAYFAKWNPALLIELGYTNSDGPSVTVPAADALVPAMDEFNTFSGRLTVGLEDVPVVNWGPIVVAPAPAPEAPKLAATGSDVASGTVGMAGLLLLLGAGAVAVSVRRRSATR